jgi:hypothetical protein
MRSLPTTASRSRPVLCPSDHHTGTGLDQFNLVGARVASAQRGLPAHDGLPGSQVSDPTRSLARAAAATETERSLPASKSERADRSEARPSTDPDRRAVSWRSRAFVRGRDLRAPAASMASDSSCVLRTGRPSGELSAPVRTRTPPVGSRSMVAHIKEMRFDISICLACH